MAKQSLFDIANQYGQGSDFGHYDAEIAKEQGYSNQDILDFLDANPGKLAAGNKAGGSDGLYDELSGNTLNFGKSVVANRGGASGAEIAESNAQRDQQFALDRIAAAGNVQANIQRLVNSANMYAADSTATWQMYGADAAKDASIYSADASERSTKYVADVDRTKAREVETIRGSFGLQLQSIVNAGAKEAEAVRGEYQLANTDLTGQYGLENTRIAGATARDVANSNKEGQILGSLMSGFWS
tara:strand:+ start:11735 stop:12463 length:729 start_codon:yes stop_codon:yes gene_type:complete